MFLQSDSEDVNDSFEGFQPEDVEVAEAVQENLLEGLVLSESEGESSEDSEDDGAMFSPGH